MIDQQYTNVNQHHSPWTIPNLHALTAGQEHLTQAENNNGPPPAHAQSYAPRNAYMTCTILHRAAIICQPFKHQGRDKPP